MGYLVGVGNEQQSGNGRLFDAHVVGVQDGYYRYWTHGAYSLERGTFSLLQYVTEWMWGCPRSRFCRLGG